MRDSGNSPILVTENPKSNALFHQGMPCSVDEERAGLGIWRIFEIIHIEVG
jgi:hypothetical protein